MVNSSFGRARPAGRPPPPSPRPAPAAPPGDPVAEEIAAWKRARPRPPFPWKPFAWTLSLCAMIASLALPDTVNDVIAYALYAVAVIGFLSGLSRRGPKSF